MLKFPILGRDGPNLISLTALEQKDHLKHTSRNIFTILHTYIQMAGRTKVPSACNVLVHNNDKVVGNPHCPWWNLQSRSLALYTKEREELHLVHLCLSGGSYRHKKLPTNRAGNPNCCPGSYLHTRSRGSFICCIYCERSTWILCNY